jgi:hypothetical protein
MRLLHVGRNLGANGRLRKLTYLAGRVAARFLNRYRQDGFLQLTKGGQMPMLEQISV